MAISALLFDLDNTLIDFMRMKRLGSHEAARAMFRAGADFPFSLQESGDILFGAYKDDIEGESVFREFISTHDQGPAGNRRERIEAAAVNAYLKVKANHLDPYPSVQSTLIQLHQRGFKLGILTDAPRFKAYQRLDAAGLTDFFHEILTSTDTEVQKPDPRAFQKALQAMGTSPAETLMVGDWGERDVDGARAAGMQAAWAKYGNAPGTETPALANHVLTKFSDLLRVVSLY